MSVLDTIRQAATRLFRRTQPSVVTLTPAARALPATVDHEFVVEPSARSWIEWTPDLIEAAEIQCAGGSLRMAADLCHALLADDRVEATLGVRTRGLVGLPVSFEAGADKRRSARVLRAIEADEDWWQMAPEAALSELLQWAVLLGVGFAKLVPVEGVSGRGLLRLEVWDPRWFRYDWSTRRWMVTLDTGAEVPVESDGRWIVFTPYGEHAPWQRGIWRPIARWWLLKQYARSDWGRHGEVKASGLIVGFTTGPKQEGQPSLSPTQRKALAAQFKTLGRDAAVVLPPGIDVKLIEAAANNFQTFEAQINAANTGIAIAVLGQNLTTEVQGGSYAAAQVHKLVADYLRRSDAECLSTTLHDQLLLWWAAYNFLDPAVAPWPRWKVDPDNDVGALGDAYKKLGDGLAALAAQVPEGYEIDRKAILERAGVPLRALPKPPAAAPPVQLPMAA